MGPSLLSAPCAQAAKEELEMPPRCCCCSLSAASSCSTALLPLLENHPTAYRTRSSAPVPSSPLQPCAPLLSSPTAPHCTPRSLPQSPAYPQRGSRYPFHPSSKSQCLPHPGSTARCCPAPAAPRSAHGLRECGSQAALLQHWARLSLCSAAAVLIPEHPACALHRRVCLTACAAAVAAAWGKPW